MKFNSDFHHMTDILYTCSANSLQSKVISKMTFDLFSKWKIKVIPVKDFDNGIVFYVKNGKGLLRVKYGSLNGKGLCALVFDGIPLIKFHGDEYLCPTCEKFISAGYGLCMSKNKVIEELGATLNAPFVSIRKSFDDLKPLFGLLPTGYYTLSSETLLPTDGQGNFFWKVSNIPTLNHATCPVHDPQSFEWSSPIPRYIFPTQSPKLFNKNRVEHYRNKEDTRAIAYYFNEGYLCALLDGHHKATAAALNGVPLKALVISEARGFSFPHESKGMKSLIYFDKVSLYEDEMIDNFDNARKLWGVGNRMSDSETAQYLALENDDFNYVWHPEILKTANSYYDVYDLACLEWAGDLSDDRIKEMLTEKKLYDESMVSHMAHALYKTKNPSFLEFTIFYCKNENYVHIWYDMFKLLANIKNQQVEDFFIEYLVNDENLRPYITQVVNDYFAIH